MSTVHVVPDWQEHDHAPWCWCKPQREVVPPDGEVWAHRAYNDDPNLYTDGNDPALTVPGRQWQVWVDE